MLFLNSPEKKLWPACGCHNPTTNQWRSDSRCYLSRGVWADDNKMECFGTDDHAGRFDRVFTQDFCNTVGDGFVIECRNVTVCK
ncbi:hypothetical protein PG999_007772 [Apiospora kogelbergensis]|uniref:Uncharacterized protein n=1 Tax=Apiospora kogelbergensis TaxID=1337665 RepID=A0AAW0QMI4_9PEZI